MSSFFDRLQGEEASLLDAIHTILLRNPLNTALAFVILYLFVSLLLPYRIAKLTPSLGKARSPSCNHTTSYSYLPEHPPVIVWKKYTPRTLAVHDGSDVALHGSKKASTSEDSKILLAISGNVYDVTKGAHFYGPGGPYGNFAGRDASRGMAKQSFDLDTLTPLDQPIDLLQDLTPMEISAMREWESHFTSKYGVVGTLVNEGEEDS
ncbi:hypothetical protein CBS101457_001215 [Exobasidium rhododendri]|nr:hypothetical protein CBS101457_001215 [Exobasidium rhododendri]